MKYLLDTQILLWARLSPEKLTKDQQDILTSSPEEKFVSLVSIWEISLKYSVGKLNLGDHTPDEFVSSMYKLGIKTITPTEKQYATFYLLPKVLKHKDPFDRMIIWHAIESGLTLISGDKKMQSYKVHGLKLI